MGGVRGVRNEATATTKRMTEACRLDKSRRPGYAQAMSPEEQYSLYLCAFVGHMTDTKTPNPHQPPRDDIKATYAFALGLRDALTVMQGSGDCECTLLLPRDQEDFEYTVDIRKPPETQVVN